MIKKKYFNFKFLFNRILWEINYPSNFFFKRFLILCNNIFKKKNYVNQIDDDSLFAFYDFNISALTFNFAEFLVLCHNELNKKKLKKLIIIFVKENYESYKILKKNSDFHLVHDRDSMNWRMHNIILPLISTSTKCAAYFVSDNNIDIDYYLKKKNIFPYYYKKNYKINYDINEFYKIDNINSVSLTCPNQSLRYINQWINAHNYNKKKLITITIRNQKLESERNSSIDDWYKFSEYLVKKGYSPIIIPDTETCWELKKKFEKFHVFTEPSWNLLLRMAIYQESFLNFFIPNGPETLATLNSKTSYVMLNLIPVIGSKVNTKKSLQIFKNQDYKFSTKYQKLIFKKDSYENIVNSFNEFLEIK